MPAFVRESCLASKNTWHASYLMDYSKCIVRPTNSLHCESSLKSHSESSFHAPETGHSSTEVWMPSLRGPWLMVWVENDIWVFRWRLRLSPKCFLFMHYLIYSSQKHCRVRTIEGFRGNVRQQMKNLFVKLKNRVGGPVAFLTTYCPVDAEVTRLPLPPSQPRGRRVHMSMRCRLQEAGVEGPSGMAVWVGGSVLRSCSNPDWEMWPICGRFLDINHTHLEQGISLQARMSSCFWTALHFGGPI